MEPLVFLVVRYHSFGGLNIIGAFSTIEAAEKCREEGGTYLSRSNLSPSADHVRYRCDIEEHPLR